MNQQTETLLELAFLIGELFRKKRDLERELEATLAFLIGELFGEKRDLERELEATRIEHARTLERCAEAEKLVAYLQERDDSRRELDEKLIAWCVRQETLCNLAHDARVWIERFQKGQISEGDVGDLKGFLKIASWLADGVIAVNNPAEVNPSSKTAVA